MLVSNFLSNDAGKKLFVLYLQTFSRFEMIFKIKNMIIKIRVVQGKVLRRVGPGRGQEGELQHYRAVRVGLDEKEAFKQRLKGAEFLSSWLSS